MEHVEDAILRYWSTQRLSDDFTTRVSQNLHVVLEETTTSLRLLHEQLTAELGKIDRQEENLLDLAADAALPTAKVRTRLTRLQAKRKDIRNRLANSDDRLAQGATVLEAQLALLQNPQELYRRLSDHGRRLLNQAIFEELLLDQEDLTIEVVGQTYTEPIRDLMLAAQADREQSEARLMTIKSRPAANGEPAWRTLTSLLRPVSLDEGWSKTAMVDLVTAYSKRPDLLDDLDRAVCRTAKTRARIETRSHGETAAPPLFRARRLVDRIGDELTRDLRTDRQSGLTMRALAERYGISLSSVKRILRRERD